MTEKKKYKGFLYTAGILFALFLFLILAVKLIDVQAIGPNASSIGLATVNRAVKNFFGLNLIWYDITDLLGYAAIAVAFCFGVLGVCQLINRKSIKRVDHDILLLAVFYVLVISAYIFFEICVVNYRPILINSQLEASFPSSHTMLSVCIMSTAMYLFAKKIKQKVLCGICIGVSGVIMLATVIGRLVCGVHWFTDILGGLLLSGALIFAYIGACRAVENKISK